MCANKSGLSKPYHAASLPCGAQEGECCSWISNFLGLEEISHPTFLPCPVCAMSKQKSPDTVHRNQHYKKQHQHAAAGHSRNTVACYGTDTMLKHCLYTKLKKKRVAQDQWIWVCNDTIKHQSPVYAQRLSLPFHLKMCLMTGKISFTSTFLQLGYTLINLVNTYIMEVSQIMQENYLQMENSSSTHTALFLNPCQNFLLKTSCQHYQTPPVW